MLPQIFRHHRKLEQRSRLSPDDCETIRGGSPPVWIKSKKKKKAGSTTLAQFHLIEGAFLRRAEQLLDAQSTSVSGQINQSGD